MSYKIEAPGNTLLVDGVRGSDANPSHYGYATIDAALSGAVSGDTIEVASGTYVEDITVTTGTHLKAGQAILTGTIIQEADSTVDLYVQNVLTGTTGITLTGVGASGRVNLDYQFLQGTADGILVDDAGGVLFFTSRLQAVQTGEGLSSASLGSVVYDVDLIGITGAGTGLSVSATGDAVGHICAISDDGTGTAIELQAGGGANLHMQSINTNTAYTVGAGGELTLFAPRIDGIQTNAGTADISPVPLAINTLFVNGANGDDGTPYPNGYATIGAALAAASAGDVIEVAAGAYTESIVDGVGCTILGDGVDLTGNGSPNITLINGSRIRLRSLTVPAAEIGVLQATAAARAHADIDTINAGAASFGIVNTAADAILYAKGSTINVAAGGFAVGDITTSDGHIDVDYDNIYGTGAAGFGLATFGTGFIVGRVGHFLDRTGTLTAITAQGTNGVEIVTAEIETTTGILVNATSSVKVIAGEVECTAAFNVTAGGILTLIAATLEGTQTGDAWLTVAGQTWNHVTDIDDTDSPYAILATDSSINADATANPVIANLPTAVGRRGKRYEHFAEDITNANTLVPQAGEEIHRAGGVVYTNGVPYLAAAQYDCLTIESDGVNWNVR